METMRHEQYMRLQAEYEEKQRQKQHAQDKMVNRPPHYNTAEIECIDAIKAATGDGFQYHLQGTILKYLWRYRYKGKPVQDLQKARWYLDRLIEELDPDTV